MLTVLRGVAFDSGRRGLLAMCPSTVLVIEYVWRVVAGTQQDKGVGHCGGVGALASPSTATSPSDGLPGNRGSDHVSVSYDL